MLSIIALAAAIVQQELPPPPPGRERRVFVHASDGRGLDSDGDGTVTREEFAAPMAKAFDEMDKDGDGRLSASEMAERRGPPPGDHLIVTDEGSPAERRIRIEGDGFPGGEERRETRVVVIAGDGDDDLDMPAAWVHEDGPRRMEMRRVTEDAPEMDADGDGRVSEAEFVAPLVRAFRGMDADGSGYLEQAERAGDRRVQVITRRVDRREGDGN